MKHMKDSAPDASAAGAGDSWLAGIKAEAAHRQARRDIGTLSEDEVLDEAARGIAERRAARHDLIGALVWEEIAHGTRPRTSEPAEADSPRIDGPGVPAAERTGRD